MCCLLAWCALLSKLVSSTATFKLQLDMGGEEKVRIPVGTDCMGAAVAAPAGTVFCHDQTPSPQIITTSPLDRGGGGEGRG